MRISANIVVSPGGKSHQLRSSLKLQTALYKTLHQIDADAINRIIQYVTRKMIPFIRSRQTY